MTTGKLLYCENQENYDASSDQMNNYEVYQADKKDITYTRDFYNYTDKSINLLKSTKPLDR